MAYASRALHKAEKNYATVKKEALAIVWAVRVYKPYLYCYKFEVITDHCPLSTLLVEDGQRANWQTSSMDLAAERIRL